MFATYVEAVNAIIALRRPTTTVAIHICRGNARNAWAAAGGYAEIAKIIFPRLEVDTYLLEYDDERSGDFVPLTLIPRDKKVVLGLVTTKHGELEKPRRAAPPPRRGRALLPARELRREPAMRLRQHGRGQRHRVSEPGGEAAPRRRSRARCGGARPPTRETARGFARAPRTARRAPRISIFTCGRSLFERGLERFARVARVREDALLVVEVHEPLRRPRRRIALEDRGAEHARAGRQRRAEMIEDDGLLADGAGQAVEEIAEPSGIERPDSGGSGASALPAPCAAQTARCASRRHEARRD